MLLKPGDGHGCKHAACRAPIDADILRPSRFQQVLVDAGHVFAGCGKLVLGSLAVVEAHDFDAGKGCDGPRFQFRTTRPASREPPTVQIDEYALLVPALNSRLRAVDKYMHARNLCVLQI